MGDVLYMTKIKKKKKSNKTTVCCDIYECTKNTMGVCQSAIVVFSFSDETFAETCLNLDLGDDN